MKTALAVLLMVASMSSAAFAADVPVYPGAKMSEMLTQADQEQHPGSVAYTTPDAFEKVYEVLQDERHRESAHQNKHPRLQNGRVHLSGKADRGCHLLGKTEQRHDGNHGPPGQQA
jgi:hypothetical protein